MEQYSFISHRSAFTNAMVMGLKRNTPNFYGFEIHGQHVLRNSLHLRENSTVGVTSIHKTVNTATSRIFYLLALPASYLSRKIGERWLQLLGGILLASGGCLTGFTTAAWQVALLVGVIMGEFVTAAG